MRRFLYVLSLPIVLTFGPASGCTEEGNSGGKEGDGASVEDLARVGCQYVFNCECEFPQTQYMYEHECVDIQIERYHADEDLALAAGLTIDADCINGQLAWVNAVGCGLLTDELLAEASCTLSCAPYHGEGRPGDSCSWTVPGFAHDCAQGLECGASGVCDDPCGRWLLAEGQVCWNDTVEVVGVCREGLYCDTSETFSCAPIPETGEPCPAGTCNDGDWCNVYDPEQPLCTRLGAVGAYCEYDFACEDNYCVDTRCAGLPGAGEPCNGECASDLNCASGVCTFPQAKGQSCGSLPCAAELACEAGICVDATPYVCGY